MTIVGTPPNVVIRSRSISSRTRSGSKWWTMTSLPPAAVLVTRTAWQPVAWNSGTVRRYPDCVVPETSVRADLPYRSWPRVFTKKRFIRFVHVLRCVPTAPFGRPVVPDV